MIIRPLRRLIKFALFLSNFRAFSTIGYYALVVPVLIPHESYRFSLNPPFLFEMNCAYNRGRLKPAYKRLKFVHLYRVWCCCCCLSVFRLHFDRACSARQLIKKEIGPKSFVCATYHASSSLNCARVANVCRMREVCEKSRLGRNNCELIGSKSTSQSR